MTASTWPEHEKLHKVVDKSQAIGEFLEWCADEKGLHLAHLADFREDGMPVPFRPLLAEFFDIDEKRLEAEKVAMLTQMREAFEDPEGK
jgi:hypothetical protein